MTTFTFTKDLLQLCCCILKLCKLVSLTSCALLQEIQYPLKNLYYWIGDIDPQKALWRARTVMGGSKGFLAPGGSIWGRGVWGAARRVLSEASVGVVSPACEGGTSMRTPLRGRVTTNKVWPKQGGERPVMGRPGIFDEWERGKLEKCAWGEILRLPASLLDSWKWGGEVAWSLLNPERKKGENLGQMTFWTKTKKFAFLVGVKLLAEWQFLKDK